MDKKCCTCKEIKDISMFSKNKNSKDGYKKYCKKCASEQGKKYRENHKEQVLKSKKEWYEKSKLLKEERTLKALNEKYKLCNYCKKEKSIEEFYKRGNGGFYSECKVCSLEKQNKYHYLNREKILIKKRDYNKRNKEKIDKYNKIYYLKNSENIKDRVKIWKEENPSKAKDLNRRSVQIRNARKNNVISNFSKKDWEDCKNFFRNYKNELECAYCGKVLKRATQEHFIPLSKGGNYTKDNILPVCGSCNSSKCNKDFEEWYKLKEFYSEFRKQKIYEYLYKQANTVPSL